MYIVSYAPIEVAPNGPSDWTPQTAPAPALTQNNNRAHTPWVCIHVNGLDSWINHTSIQMCWTCGTWMLG